MVQPTSKLRSWNWVHNVCHKSKVRLTMARNWVPAISLVSSWNDENWTSSTGLESWKQMIVSLLFKSHSCSLCRSSQLLRNQYIFPVDVTMGSWRGPPMTPWFNIVSQHPQCLPAVPLKTSTNRTENRQLMLIDAMAAWCWLPVICDNLFNSCETKATWHVMLFAGTKLHFCWSWDLFKMEVKGWWTCFQPL